MNVPDRRPRLFAAVLSAKDLSYREKCYLLTVITLKAEHIDGIRREHSRAMGHDGKFTLHVDYIAAAMGAKSATAVREAREGCEEKNWLQRVHEGTHGRPACYHVVNNRVTDQSVRVGFLQPYGFGKSAPLRGSRGVYKGAEKPHPYL